MRTEPCWDCEGRAGHPRVYPDGEPYVADCKTCESLGRIPVDTSDSGLAEAYDPWED